MTRLAPQEIRTFFVTAVTWQRQALFKAEPMARLFLDTLVLYRDQGCFQIHGFILMPDHFHLLLAPALDLSLEKAVQLLKDGFSSRVKRELGFNAEIWQKGFTARRVKDVSDFERHVLYIRENPVRAGLENATSCPYDSAALSVELDPVPPGVKPRFLSCVEFAGLNSGASGEVEK